MDRLLLRDIGLFFLCWRCKGDCVGVVAGGMYEVGVGIDVRWPTCGVC